MHLRLRIGSELKTRIMALLVTKISTGFREVVLYQFDMVAHVLGQFCRSEDAHRVREGYFVHSTPNHRVDDSVTMPCHFGAPMAARRSL